MECLGGFGFKSSQISLMLEMRNLTENDEADFEQADLAMYYGVLIFATKATTSESEGDISNSFKNNIEFKDWYSLLAARLGKADLLAEISQSSITDMSDIW